jgi:hypothetical protein
MSLENQNKQTLLETKRDYKLTKTISIGSSFIIKASNRLNELNFSVLNAHHPLGRTLLSVRLFQLMAGTTV